MEHSTRMLSPDDNNSAMFIHKERSLSCYEKTPSKKASVHTYNPKHYSQLKTIPNQLKDSKSLCQFKNQNKEGKMIDGFRENMFNSKRGIGQISKDTGKIRRNKDNLVYTTAAWPSNLRESSPDLNQRELANEMFEAANNANGYEDVDEGIEMQDRHSRFHNVYEVDLDNYGEKEEEDLMVKRIQIVDPQVDDSQISHFLNIEGTNKINQAESEGNNKYNSEVGNDILNNQFQTTLLDRKNQIPTPQILSNRSQILILYRIPLSSNKVN